MQTMALSLLGVHVRGKAAITQGGGGGIQTGRTWLVLGGRTLDLLKNKNKNNSFFCFAKSTWPNFLKKKKKGKLA